MAYRLLLNNTFLTDKQVACLRSIRKGSYVTSIMKEADSTYTYAFQLMRHFKKKDFITTKKSGRKQMITLTEKGESIISLYLQIENILKGDE